MLNENAPATGRRPPATGFVGKRVTVMGLGTRGGGVGVARFLAEQGAIVTVTDGKSGLPVKVPVPPAWRSIFPIASVSSSPSAETKQSCSGPVLHVAASADVAPSEAKPSAAISTGFMTI